MRPARCFYSQWAAEIAAEFKDANQRKQRLFAARDLKRDLKLESRRHLLLLMLKFLHELVNAAILLTY